jgi:branched-chain amino acid transport system substrate-binding protein
MATIDLRRALVAALAAGLALSACGGGRDEGSSDGGSASNSASAPGGTVPGGSAPAGTSGFTIDTADCDEASLTQGITDDAIKLGASLPLSGVYGTAFAPIAKGYQAYFDYLNETEGGIDGRKIEVVVKDDEYNSSKTKANTEDLVANEEVFAMFNVVGTPNNLAIRDDLGEQCVPSIYLGTGSQLWGQTEEYPWLIGSIPSYATEAAVFAEYLQREKPDAKVAILKQNDDFGEGYVEAFEKAIDGSGIEVVKTETYDSTAPDTTSQITSLSGSGADTLLLAATALACPNSLKAAKGIAGWDPLVYISATCTSKTVVGLAGPEATTGVYSTIYLKDPADPAYDGDEAMQTFKTEGPKYGLAAEDLTNGVVVYGWTMGQLFAETVRRAGPELDRAKLMETAYSLDGVDLPLLRDGVQVNTDGAEDPFPIETLYVAQYDGQVWKGLGDAVAFEGRTTDYVPQG